MAVSLTYGVDVGATSVKAAAVMPDGLIIAESLLPTPADSTEEVIRTIERSLTIVRSEAPNGLAIGVGIPGWTSADRRRVIYSPNLPWRDEALADHLETTTGLGVVLENDANAAAWAEYRFGAAKSARSMIALTLGSGVGGAIIAEGALWRGAHGSAGEIGHCVVVTEGLPCACGRSGCLENYGSGRSLDCDAADAFGTGENLQNAATDGDDMARSIFRRYGARVGRGLANACLLVNPELIVIGGGVSGAFEWFIKSLRRGLRDEMGPHWSGVAPEIVPAGLGDAAGRVGAADLARDTLR
ncbi:ROK family glucokinase [soil metagenome]